MKRVIYAEDRNELFLGKFIVILSDTEIEGLDSTYYQSDLRGYFIHHEFKFNTITNQQTSNTKTHADLINEFDIAPFLSKDKVVYGSVLPDSSLHRRLSISPDNLLDGNQVEWIEDFFML